MRPVTYLAAADYQDALALDLPRQHEAAAALHGREGGRIVRGNI